jgi:protein-S-isoprenylcysteine O-methyltransferase Ste14
VTPPRPVEPWWKGARGEWWVAAQFALMLLLFLGPRSWPRDPNQPVFTSGVQWWAGAALVVAGGALCLLAARWLGSALSPIPYPVEHAPLVQSGPFALVRHPIYTGLLAVGIGLALVTVGWLTWVYTAGLFLVLDTKSRREERWLCEKFAEYPAYQRRVRKLLPFVY